MEGANTFRDSLEEQVAIDLAVAGTLDASGGVEANGITMDDDTDITGVDTIEGYNDLRLRGDADGGNDLVIRADGHIDFGVWLTPSSLSTIEGNEADKMFLDDTSCSDGEIAPLEGDNNQVGICVCANASRTGQASSRGWHCFQ